VDDQKRDSVGINRRVRLALYDIAVARYGKQPEFECLIDGNDRSEQIYSELTKCTGRGASDTGPGRGKAGGRRQEAEAIRQKAEERSHKQKAKAEETSEELGDSDDEAERRR
jgi:hypothetical protein